MFDDESEFNFLAEVAKTGRAACKLCKTNCEKDQVRMAKLLPNPFGSGKMKQWYHIDCLFEAFTKQRATTKKIETAEDIFGWDLLNDETQDRLLKKIKDSGGSDARPTGNRAGTSSTKDVVSERDDSLEEFRNICKSIANVGAYTDKTRILQRFITTGTNGKEFRGNLYLWIKCLLPQAEKRVYNLQSKQLVKLFSRIFKANHQEMLTDLELGDVAETVEKFFKKSTSEYTPLDKSELYLQEVEEFLKTLSESAGADENTTAFQSIVRKCTADDLKIIIRLIKHDLRINMGPRHVLDALSKDAYTMYQNSRNLKEVVDKFGTSNNKTTKGAAKAKSGDLELKLMTPIMPMLAAPCKDLDKVIARCPNGMYSEIKYDGERIQLHKQGWEFNFYSRSLKPVMEHKIKSLKEFVPYAFPTARDLILDAEVIMVDKDTGELLPFGTLGVHKKNSYKGEAQVCLFVFDCLFVDGENLTKKPLEERRKFLSKIMDPIPNRIQLSESKLIRTKDELLKMIGEVLKEGLEGLVLKSADGIYEPNKRHWWKVKKDYLADGSLADSADLVVLGAWFGTGNMGGMLSIFLMGCYDEDTNVWKTVTKAHSGLDHAEVTELQRLKKEMVRPDAKRLPSWLVCNKPLVPDMIAKDPMKMPVFEIVGAEFSKGDDGAHTADGISIRFPRVTKIRDDKEAKDGTTLQELRYLYKVYKENADLDLSKLVGGMKNSTATKSTAGSDKAAPSSSSSSSSLLTKYFSPKKKTRRGEADESTTPEEKKPKIDLFCQGILLYVPENVKSKLDDDVLRKFTEAGGVEGSNPRECSHILHCEKERHPKDLNELRKTYCRDAVHVYYRWLVNCVRQRQLVPVQEYPVHLRGR